MEGAVGGQTYTRSSSSSKDQTTQVRSALVAQGACGINESSNTITLEGRADERGAPGNGGTAGLLGLDELLLGVGRLSALVGLAEDGTQDGQLNAVVEESAEGDGRGLDGGEVYRQRVSGNRNDMSNRRATLMRQASFNTRTLFMPNDHPFIDPQRHGIEAGNKPCLRFHLRPRASASGASVRNRSCEVTYSAETCCRSCCDFKASIDGLCMYGR